MNKGFLQSSSWSSMKSQAPTSSSSSSSLAMSLNCHDDSCQELPVSWSQLLLGGSLNDFQTKKKLFDVDGWEDQMAALAHDASAAAHRTDGASQVASESGYVYGTEEIHEQQLAEAAAAWASWGQMNNYNLPASSPRSCVTTSFGSNMLDFSDSKPAEKRHLGQPVLDHSSECNSKETGAASKKIKVVPCAAQSTFRVRKEKLGDRITALHQLVSPFGKTDTASVLLEAIGYIRFLQNQVEALSSPYLGSGEPDSARQSPVKGRSCIFPEDPGQVDGGEPRGLRSRGLCLVPLSCTLHVGGSNGADYWAASLAAGFR